MLEASSSLVKVMSLGLRLLCNHTGGHVLGILKKERGPNRAAAGQQRARAGAKKGPGPGFYKKSWGGGGGRGLARACGGPAARPRAVFLGLAGPAKQNKE